MRYLGQGMGTEEVPRLNTKDGGISSVHWSFEFISKLSGDGLVTYHKLHNYMAPRYILEQNVIS